LTSVSETENTTYSKIYAFTDSEKDFLRFHFCSIMGS